MAGAARRMRGLLALAPRAGAHSALGMKTMAELPRVALILTGGTIDSVGTDRTDLAWYIEAGKRLEDGELVGRVPELKEIAQVTETPFRRLPSHALTSC